MKTLYMLAAIAALGLSGGAYAKEHDTMMRGPAKSRQEAIQRAKDAVARLEKMTDQEWAARQKQRDERRAARRSQRTSGKLPAAKPAAAPAAAPSTAPTAATQR